jgi:hypothetical protein
MAQSAYPHTAHGLIAAAATLAAWLTLGCGLAAAPQPPSLHLPKPVQDLQAERAGDSVHLTWTTPKQTTDGLKLTAPVPMRICLQDGALQSGQAPVSAKTARTPACASVGSVTTPPGKPATFLLTLPSEMTQGPPRAITVSVEALGPKQKSAGPSNPAQTWAGAAPPPVTELTAQSAPQGVLLHWQPEALPTGTVMELQRTLLAPPPVVHGASASKPPVATRGITKPAAHAGQPQVQILRVQPIADASQPNQLRDPGAAYDAGIAWGATYRYTAARVLQAAPGALSLRIASAPSTAVTVEARDTFPPAPPRGLAAVLVAAALNGGHAAVALSWIASREPDFAYYLVFRRDLASGEAATQIAPAPGAPASARVVTPADQDAAIQPGHSYAYSVSAVDLYGNASPRSAEVTVTIPAQ